MIASLVAATTTLAGGSVYNFRSRELWVQAMQHRITNGAKAGVRCFRFNVVMKKLGLQVWITTGTSPMIYNNFLCFFFFFFSLLHRLVLLPILARLAA